MKFKGNEWVSVPKGMQWIAIVVAAFITMSVSSVSYTLQDPSGVVEIASTKLLAQLEIQKDQIESDATILTALVEDLVLPIVDEKAFAKKVLGNAGKKLRLKKKTPLLLVYEGY